MTAYIGCGSNLGDRQRNLAAGLSGLVACGLRPRAVSAVWETEPVDCAGPRRFLNLAVAVDTRRDPREILDRLLEVEARLGRVRTTPGAPRPLDLDLLMVGELRRAEPGLSLPHPRMWQRRFVLAPLAEIAPGLRNPDTGRTVEQEERALRNGQPGVVRIGALATPRGTLL